MEIDKDGTIEKPSSSKQLKFRSLIFLAVFTGFPYLLSFIGKPLTHPERSKIILRWFYPFLIVCLSTLAYVYVLEFTNHEIPFQSNSTMYLFSDGYADQFGGENQ